MNSGAGDHKTTVISGVPETLTTAVAYNIPDEPMGRIL